MLIFETLRRRWRQRWDAQGQQRRICFQIWLETTVVALTGRFVGWRLYEAIEDDWNIGTTWKLHGLLFLIGCIYALLLSIVARYNGHPRVLWLASFGIGIGVAKFYGNVHMFVLLREVVLALVLTHLGWYVMHSMIMQVSRNVQKPIK